MNTIHSVSNTSLVRSSEAVAVRKSFSFRTFMMRVMLVMGIVVGGKVAWADSYTITFSTGSGDGSTASTSTACSTIVSAGATYLSGNLATATKVYYSGGSGLKLGTKNNAGTIRMNLSASGQVNATSIVVNAKLYNSGKPATLSVNGSTAQNVTADFSNFTFELSNQITYIQLNSSQYIWISSITVNYEPVASLYTVTFDHGSNNTSSLQEESVGSGVTLPTATAPGDCSAIYTFYGWAATSVSETSTAPSIVGTYGETYFPASNTTLHAVYRRVDGDIVYNLVENLSTVEEGKYYLLTPDYHAFNGTISSGHGQATANAFSFTNGVATSVPDGAVELTLSSSGDGFTMYNATYGYLYAMAANSGNLAWHNSESSFWEYSSYNWVYDDNNAYLRTFSNSSFRTYGNNSNDNLLMAMEYEPAIYNTNPSCPSVTLTYRADDATSGTAPVDINSPYNAGSRVTVLDKGTLEKTNYDFLGWNTAANGSGAEYSAGSHLYITESTVLYAQWGKKYEVTFNKGTGNCDTPSLKETNACVGVTLPEATPPARCSDYTFYGWSTSEISETSSEPLIVGTTGEHYYPSSDITLYAVYRQPNGGTVYNLITDLSTITEGEYYLVSTSNYAFNGSIRSGHGQATPNEFSFTDGVATSVPDGAVELTLSSSGYGFTMYNATYGYLYASAASSGNLAWHNSESSYWKYSNSNWTYNDNSAYLRVYDNTFRTYGGNNGNNLKMAKKVDPAIYNTNPLCNTATITYNGNGATSGSVPVDDNSPYDIGTLVTVLDKGNLIKTGHTFAGWNTAADGSGTSYLPNGEFTITENITLYAQWTPNQYIVAWYANGSLIESIPIDYGKSFLDDGYEIDGLEYLDGDAEGNACDEMHFVGWSEERFDAYEGAPTLLQYYDIVGIEVTDNKNYHAVFAKVTPGTSVTWNLVENVSELNVNDSIIIVSGDYALGTTQNTNNRDAVGITNNGDDVEFDEQTGVQGLKLVAGTEDNTFGLYTGSGYLSAASSSKNYLRTENELGNNGSWLINIDNGETTITAQGNYTHNKLRYNYNNGNPIFSCYETGQTAVSIYKKYGEGDAYSNYTTFCPCEYGLSLSDGDMVWAGKNGPTNQWNLASNWVVYHTSDSKYHLTNEAPSNCNVYVKYVNDEGGCIINVSPLLTTDVTCDGLTIDGITLNIAENQTLTINGAATFTSGIINGDVIFGEGATATGANTSSYVNGKVTKNAMSGAFTFPTGTASLYAPFEASSSTASNVSVQYNSGHEGMPDWWNHSGNLYDAGLNHASDRENWQISASATTTLSNIKLYWNTAADNYHSFEEDASALNSYLNVAVVKKNGFYWQNLGKASIEGSFSAAGSITAAEPLTITVGAKAAGDGEYFATFASSNSNLVLPIELLSFTANCNGKSSLIEWTTATEKNNDFFVLERSADAINFKEIARVAGAGNSIEPINYAYTDYGIRSGDNYYRLVQIDYDGTSTASEIIVANCPAETLGEPDVLAFPNPFDDNLTLHFENFGNMHATVEVYDMLGRMVQTQKVNCSQNDYEIVLRLAGLSDGTYNIRISTADFVVTRMVVKE